MDYIQKHSLYPAFFDYTVLDHSQMVLVIPAYNEREIDNTIQALYKTNPPTHPVIVIIVLNCKESDAQELKVWHQNEYNRLVNLFKTAPSYLVPLVIGPLMLLDKNAGVGLARKIGMDEAVRYFEQKQIPKGVIINLDADCEVSTDYFTELESYFDNSKNKDACSIYFEHHGKHLDELHTRAIQAYELHLRYIIEVQRNAGYPFAYHTIGSAFAIRHKRYQLIGGMNQRQAGEDFYFLHKCSTIGQLGELCSTKVMPSARESDRVPFGTGRAMLQQLRHGITPETYHPEIFVELNAFIELILHYPPTKLISEIQHLNCPAITDYLSKQNFELEVQRCLQNTASDLQFRKKLFQWLEPFRVLKYMHFARDIYYPSGPLLEIVEAYLRTKYPADFQNTNLTIESMQEYLRTKQSHPWEFDM